MRRRLLDLVTVLSTLLCATACVLWARSHMAGTSLLRYDPPRVLDVISAGGLLRVGWGEMTSAEHAPPPGWTVSRSSDDLRPGTTLGFGYERWRRQSPGLSADTRLLTLPYWSLALCSAGPPAARAWSWRRRRHRARAGLCPACAYDLTGNVSGTCPECGTPAPAW